MILNKEYDMSLWLMLHSDKINRDIIANFISNIPEELYEEIKNSLNFYMYAFSRKDVNININEYTEKTLSGEVVTTGDMKYWYMINPQTGSLELGEAIIDGEFEYDTIQVTLFPVSDTKVMNMKNYTDCLIGEYIYNYGLDDSDDLSVLDFDLMTYYLFKLPFGRAMLNCCDLDKNKYRLLNMEIIPCNYNVNDLESKKELRKLVRGRRYKKF